jgi:integrase
MRTLVRIKKWESQPRYKFVVTYQQGGKRVVRYFADERSAKAFAAEKQVELLNEGRRNGELTGEEHRAVLAAREKGFNLKDAVDYYAQHVAIESVSVESAIEEFLSVRQGEGKSPVHLKDLRLRLKAFSSHCQERMVATISTKELDGWLHGLARAPQTKVNYRRVLHGFFAFCAARGYCADNPVSAARKPKVPPQAINILTTDQTRALLLACSPEILPAVAIAAFAGLRRAEIERLDWAQVDITRGFIQVLATNSKTAQRRLVPILPNLATWISPLHRSSGAVCPTFNVYRRLFVEALKGAGIASWPANSLRHSFASYRLADTQDAAKVALELGHTESRTLFQHYREVVRVEQAKAVWQTFPLACIATQE